MEITKLEECKMRSLPHKRKSLPESKAYAGKSRVKDEECHILMTIFEPLDLATPEAIFTWTF
jgi:hypothetical protein